MEHIMRSIACKIQLTCYQANLIQQSLILRHISYLYPDRSCGVDGGTTQNCCLEKGNE